jgi:hypothetical protein
MAKQKYIGEFPHDIRQLANILWENKNILANFLTTFANWRIYCGKTKIYWRISTAFRQLENIVLTFAIGECTVGETPYWRSYIDSVF